MQCNQPFYTGFQTPQFCPYQTQPLQSYPDVIGEGDVISMRLSDGCVQWYFVPFSRRDRWIPNFNSSYYFPSSLPPPCSNNNEAWFIRNFLNTCPAAGPNQLPNVGDLYSRSYANINSPCNGFVQKFHNDGCTSTTDLQYFFPNLRQAWAKGCAALQVEIPKQEKCIFHYGTVCSRPCYCDHKIDPTKTGPTIGEPNCKETPMCVDEVKSKHSCCCDESRKKERARRKNQHHSCACQSSSSDKAVSTYADQAVSCTDMKGHECHGGKERTVERLNIATELWYPRRRKPKKTNSKCSSDGAACDSACCLGSACSNSP